MGREGRNPDSQVSGSLWLLQQDGTSGPSWVHMGAHLYTHASHGKVLRKNIANPSLYDPSALARSLPQGGGLCFQCTSLHGNSGAK